MTVSHKELEKKYHGRKTPGKAEFRFKKDSPTSFHFEVTPQKLKWNFSYGESNPSGGSPLDGTFYYNEHFFDEDSDEPIESDFYVEKSVRLDHILHAHIKFYAPKSQDAQGPGDKLLGEFLSKDLRNAVSSFESREEHLQGKWEVVHKDSLEDRLRKTYAGHETDGKALFFKSGASDVPSLHFAIDKLGWEFSHGGDPPEGGSGLDGIFFYHPRFFEDSETVKADFYVGQDKEGKVTNVHIKFYEPDPLDKKLLGEFLAADPDHKAEGSGLLEDRKEGKWEPVLVSWDDVLKGRYKEHWGAEALFYKSSENPKLRYFRFEAYEQLWELSDDPYKIGHRLPGTLFFNGVFHGDNLGPTTAKYYIERKGGRSGYVTLIKFYESDSNVMLLGEFLAKDPDDIAGNFGIVGKDLTGEWKQANYVTASATAFKESNSKLITLSIAGYIAKMECKTEGEIFKDAFKVSGRLTIKKHGDFGNFVRWYKDRAIFYKDSHAKDFTAFFFSTRLVDNLGSKDDLEWNVIWNETAPKEA